MVTSAQGFKEVHLWMEGAAQDCSPEPCGRAKDGQAQRITDPTQLRAPCVDEGEFPLQ